jgi:hypothetical protein
LPVAADFSDFCNISLNDVPVYIFFVDFYFKNKFYEYLDFQKMKINFEETFLTGDFK